MIHFFLSVPRLFDEDRPAVKFTEEHYSMPMKEHPLACWLPKAGSHPSMHPGPEKFRCLAVHEESPKSVRGFLWKKIPCIHLHIVTFDDGTLVSLMWPHVMCDCMGWAIILKSWASIIAGRGHNVPTFNGFSQDAMGRLGKTRQPNKSVLETRLTGLAGLKAKGNRIKEVFSASPKMESRIFCLPAEFLQKIYGAAVSAVAHDFHLSEDDVITAWASQILCKRMPTSSRLVAICKFFDSRPLLPEVFAKHGVYVQNASFPYVAKMTAESMCSSPISNVAKEIRLAYMEQARREQLLPLASLMYQDHLDGKVPLLAKLDAHPVIFINWNKVNLWSTVDFTDAVLPSIEVEEEELDPISPDVRARPVYFHTDLVGENDLSHHEVFAMYGKDPKGNFWMSASLRRESMACFEREFHKLSSK